MIYNKYVEIGRVVLIAKGKDEGKLAVIVNVVDANRVLLDGPSTKVKRSVRNFKDLHLTKFVLPIMVGQRTKKIQLAFDKAEISKKFSEMSWAKKLATKKIRAGLNDFQRFKVFRAKQLSRRIIGVELAKLNGKSKKIKKAAK